MIASDPSAGKSEAVILIKAAPQVGNTHGETVCCAGLDVNGRWLRLYPVSFRHLDDSKKFKRWDRITFHWKLPNDDRRQESRRVDQNSIEITGSLREHERERFLARSIVTGLNKERQAGRSLALLKPVVREFVIEKKPIKDVAQERERFEAIRSQGDLFSKQVARYSPCPFLFKYKYSTDDGERFGTCQDWEVEATFFRWSKIYGEREALSEMRRVYGEVYPQKGMLLAMGTHSQYPDVWLINGIIRMDEVSQMTLF
jgi:hypothetical protein